MMSYIHVYVLDGLNIHTCLCVLAVCTSVMCCICSTANGDGCADVTIEELVKFNLTVSMEECLDPSDMYVRLLLVGVLD